MHSTCPSPPQTVPVTIKMKEDVLQAHRDSTNHPSPAEFAFSVMRCSVAHLAIGVGSSDPEAGETGFKAVDTDALNLMSDVVGRYIETLGLHARENANAAGRTKANAYDVLNAFSMLSPRPLSFAELHNHAIKNGLELPFDRSVQDFPAKKKASRGSTYGAGVSPVGFHNAVRPGHVPDFLPPLPDSQHEVQAIRQPKDSGNRKQGERRRQELKRKQQASAAHRQLRGGVDTGAQSTSNIDLQSNPRQKKKSKLRHQRVSAVSSSVAGALIENEQVGSAAKMSKIQKKVLEGTAKTKG